MSTLSRLYGQFSFKLANEGGAAAVMADLKYGSTLHTKKGILMHCQPRVPVQPGKPSCVL